MKEFQEISSLIFLFLFLFSSCDSQTQLKNELRFAQAELRELKKEREILKSNARSAQEALEETRQIYLKKNYALQTEVKQIREYKRRYDRIVSAYDMLKDQYARLKSWSDELIDGYGPAIYSGGVYDRPLFDHRTAQSTAPGMVDELNEMFGKDSLPLLVYRKTDANTVYLGVDNALKLTTGMGSSGARSYMQSVLYSLSSLEEIDCVNFDFEEGDHAAPGRYCRSSTPTL